MTSPITANPTKTTFTQFITEQGGKVIETFGVTPDQQDFTAELDQDQVTAPRRDLLWRPCAAGRARALADGKLGLDAQFEGVSGIKSDAFVTGVGSEVAEGSLSFIEGTPLEKPARRRSLFAELQGPLRRIARSLWPSCLRQHEACSDVIESTGPNREKSPKH